MIRKNFAVEKILSLLVLLLLPAACAKETTKQVVTISNPTVTTSFLPGATHFLPTFTATTYLQLVTATATPSSFITPTQIPTASPTPKLSPTTISPTPKPSLRGPLLAIIDQDPAVAGAIQLLDLSNGTSRWLQLKGGMPSDAKWSQDGCQLYVTLNSPTESSIVRTNLQGTIVSIVFQHLQDQAPSNNNEHFARWTMSPTREWIAYIAFSGEQYYASSEFQDVRVLRVDDNTQQFKLTNRGGAWRPVWSPDGLHLAYSDYDMNGVGQVYLSNPDGTDIIQLTNFTTLGTRIGIIQWSHDSNAVAFATYHASEPGYLHHPDETGSLWIVSTDGMEQRQVIIEKDIKVFGDHLWWSQDDAQLIFYARTPNNQSGTDDILYWVDATSGNLLHTLASSETPDGFFEIPFVVSDQIVGFVANHNVYLYDTTTQNIKLLTKLEPDRLLYSVQPGPLAFSDETQCEP